MRSAWLAWPGLGLLLATTALAQSGDPTRPPAELLPGAAASDAASAPQLPPPVLQGTKTGPGQQPTALIDGKVLRVGDLLHEARVVRITENGVLLRTSTGTESWLHLLPDASKAGAKAQTGREKQ